ncbi:hypothetical protein [Helicobacter sp. 23-1045]
MNFWSIFTQNLAIPLRRAIPKFPPPLRRGIKGVGRFCECRI